MVVVAASALSLFACRHDPPRERAVGGIQHSPNGELCQTDAECGANYHCTTEHACVPNRKPVERERPGRDRTDTFQQRDPL